MWKRFSAQVLFLLLMTGYSSASVLHTSLRHNRDLQEQASKPVLYHVRLYLALYYVNHGMALQFESQLQATSTAKSAEVSHFCEAVNIQAGGEQVSTASERVDATIVTNVRFNRDGSPNFECGIVNVNRRYDDDAQDIVGKGYFILEVAVQQRVYVMSNATLSKDEVTNLVKSGFSRSTGGRGRFRRLLLQQAAYSTVLDVALLDGSLSPPQAAPSSSPSAFPTLEPSAPPTLAPTNVASQEPSALPSAETFLSPTPTPSVQTSGGTGNIPTKGTTLRPTRAPTIPSGTTPDAVTDEEGVNRKGVIIVAVFGGLALILVSGFFIFCVWPFCMDSYKDEEREGERRGPVRPRAGQQLTNTGVSSIEPTVVKASSLIPGQVQLDDHQSVTSGLVGDHSSVDVFRRAPTTTSRIRLVSADDGIRMLDTSSFDDSSLYTSTTSVSNFQVHSTAQTKVHHGPVDLDDDVDINSEEGSGSYPFFGVTKVASAVEDDGCGTEGRQDQDNVSRQQDSPNEYDPFPDYSSNTSGFSEDFGGDHGHSAFAVSSAAGSNYQNESTLTGDTNRPSEIEQLLLGEISKAADGLISFDSSEYEQREGPTVDSREDTSEHFPKEKRSPASKDEREPKSRAENNSLLRRILEDARKLTEPKTTTSVNSKMSRRSAPPRLPRKKDGREATDERTFPSDLLADHIDLEHSLSLASLSSKRDAQSVGGIPVGKDRQRDTGKAEPWSTLHRAVESEEQSGFCEHTGLESDPSNDRGSVILKLLQTPTSPEPNYSNSQNDEAFHVAVQPREAWSTVFEEKEPDSPQEGSIPVVEDETESTGTKSRGSYRTNSSRRSGSQRSLRKELEQAENRLLSSEHSVSFSSAGVSFVSGSNTDQQNQIGMPPRSLDSDLKRLDVQLAKVLQHDIDHATSSSIAASSTGASRSTKSTRRSHKRRMVVLVPPGKLGIILANRNDGKGTTVSEVRSSSAMQGLLSPGDKLVAVDGEDVSDMVVSDITALMASRSERTRRLTVITSAETKRGLLQETKQED